MKKKLFFQSYRSVFSFCGSFCELQNSQKLPQKILFFGSELETGLKDDIIDNDDFFLAGFSHSDFRSC